MHVVHNRNVFPLNYIEVMKKILYTLGVSLLIAGGAQAAVVFTENFNGQSLGETGSGGIVLGGASPDVAVGEWFGGINGVAINDELQFTDIGGNRGRGAGVWLDSSAWTNGTVTVKFDILDFVDAGAGSAAFYEAYYATGVDASSTVSLDVHGNGSSEPVAASTGTATIGMIGARTTIAGNATQAEFTFDFTGQGNIALVFYNRDGAASNQPAYSVDNLTVAVPETSSTALLLGLAAASLLFIRRRNA